MSDKGVSTVRSRNPLQIAEAVKNRWLFFSRFSTRISENLKTYAELLYFFTFEHRNSPKKILGIVTFSKKYDFPCFFPYFEVLIRSNFRDTNKRKIPTYS